MPELHSQSQPEADQREQLADVLEEITERIESGNSVDLDHYQRQYPKLAEQLKKLVPAVSVLEGLGRSTSQRTTEGKPSINQLGDFRIIREIGRGGMGTVYEAQQLSMDRRVALKVLPFAALVGDRQLLRFKNEARTAGTLHHPHIVPVYSVGVERGVHYYAMQYVEGPSLAEVLIDLRSDAAVGAGDASLEPSDLQPTTVLTESGTTFAAAELPESASNTIVDTRRELQAILSTARSSSSERKYFDMITKWGIQACEALAHAHESGVLHRDIKPGNLLVDERGELWITDFGLARLERDVSMTTSGDIVGTLRYMAPEQALGKRVLIDHRADIYSLGATLYELLTLRPAFSGEDREELFQAVAYHEPVPLRKHDASIPSDLETIVLKALEKRPEDRYLTAEEMADDLKRFLDDKPIHAKPASLLQHAAKWSRRHVAVVWSLVFVFLTASVLMAIATAAVMRERSRTNAALERAATSAQLAKDAVDDMYVSFAEEWIRSQMGLSETERSFLEKAAAFYAQIPVDLEASPATQISAAKTLRRLSAARAKLGQHDEATHAIEQAISILEALHAESPTSRKFDSQLELAECYFARAAPRSVRSPQPHEIEFARRAVQELEPLCAEDPDDGDLSSRLAMAKSVLALHHEHLREYDEADRLHAEAHAELQQLVESSPDNLVFLSRLFTVVRSRASSNLFKSGVVVGPMRDGRSDDARQLFLLSVDLAEQLSEMARGDVRYRFAAAAGGWSAIYFVDSAEAVELLRKSEEQLKALIQLDPARSDFKVALRIVYHQLGKALSRLERHEEFVEVMKLDIALRGEPDPWDFARLAESLGKLERWHEAREAMDKAIRLDRQRKGDGVSILLRRLADVCRQTGDEDAARVAELERQEWISGRIAELTRLIESQPTGQAYFDRARLFVEQLNDPEKALADFTKCIESDPSIDAAYIGRAITFHILGRDQEAVRDCNAVLERSQTPFSRNAKRVLASLLTVGSPDVRDPERALELATQLLTVRRDHSSLQSAGYAFYRLGRYDEARDALQEASECGKLPNDKLEWTWIVLAMTQFQLEDRQEAHDLFGKAMELFSDRAANEGGGDASDRRIIQEAAKLLDVDLSATQWAEPP